MAYDPSLPPVLKNLSFTVQASEKVVIFISVTENTIAIIFLVKFSNPK